MQGNRGLRSAFLDLFMCLQFENTLEPVPYPLSELSALNVVWEKQSLIFNSNVGLNLVHLCFPLNTEY